MATFDHRLRDEAAQSELAGFKTSPPLLPLPFSTRSVGLVLFVWCVRKAPFGHRCIMARLESRPLLEWARVADNALFAIGVIPGNAAARATGIYDVVDIPAAVSPPGIGKYGLVGHWGLRF